MRATSDTYRQDMQSGFRNVWQPSLRLGLIDDSLQGLSSIYKVDGDIVTSDDFKQYDGVVEIGTPRYIAATWERNLTKADGDTYFGFEDTKPVKWCGVFSNQVNTIEVITKYSTLPKEPFDLTYTFIDNSPKSIVVDLLKNDCSTVIKSFEVTNDDSLNMEIVIEELEVTSTQTSGGVWYLRMRVLESHIPTQLVKVIEVATGTFVDFPVEDILSSSGSYDDLSSIASLDLPQTNASITINNEGNKYTNSVFSKLRKGQSGFLTINYTSFDDIVDNIHFPVLQLDDFKVNDKEMTLKFVDYLRYETKQVQNTTSSTTVGGYLDSIDDDYFNPSFETITDSVVDGIPVDVDFGKDDTVRGVKDYIKLLACYGGVTMRNTGKSVTVESLGSVIGFANEVVESKFNMPKTKLDGFIDANAVPMALYEPQRTKADGVPIFRPHDELNTHELHMFITDAVGDEFGHFEEDIVVTVSNISYETNNLFLKFDEGSIPRQIKFETFNKDGDTLTPVEVFTINGNTSPSILVKEEMKPFNCVRVTMNDLLQGNARLQVYGFNAGRAVYSLNSELLLKEPEQQREDVIRSVTVNYYGIVDDIIDYVGSKTVVCNTAGVDVLYDHPIVFDEITATLVANRLAEYYTNDLVYTVEFVGDPSIEVSDLVEVDTYKGKIVLELESVSTSFSNGGIRGTMRGKEYKNG